MAKFLKDYSVSILMLISLLVFFLLWLAGSYTIIETIRHTFYYIGLVLAFFVFLCNIFFVKPFSGKNAKTLNVLWVCFSSVCLGLMIAAIVLYYQISILPDAVCNRYNYEKLIFYSYMKIALIFIATIMSAFTMKKVSLKRKPKNEVIQ
ncbi:MAG: hypothetical protein LKJ88_02535 [Bacilli bacterium]|nr:hypothetical protein [Bacilli bacterium]